MDTTYSEEELERCTLRNPREVIFQLRGMIKRGDRVTVLFQEGRQSFLTVLLDLSEDKGLLYPECFTNRLIPPSCSSGCVFFQPTDNPAPFFAHPNPLSKSIPLRVMLKFLR